MVASPRYAIRVRGHLDPDWAAWLDNVTIENCANGDAVLTASFADQAALHGLINRVFALNLPLLALNPVRSEPARKRLPDENGAAASPG